MKILHATTLSFAVATMALSGCNRSDDHQAADAGVAQQEAVEAKTVIGKAVQKEIEKARKELRDGNLVISGQGHVGFSIGAFIGAEAVGRLPARVRTRRRRRRTRRANSKSSRRGTTRCSAPSSWRSRLIIRWRRPIRWW